MCQWSRDAVLQHVIVTLTCDCDAHTRAQSELDAIDKECALLQVPPNRNHKPQTTNHKPQTSNLKTTNPQPQTDDDDAVCAVEAGPHPEQQQDAAD